MDSSASVLCMTKGETPRASTGAISGIQMSVQQTLMAIGKAKASLFIACLRKIILLIPLIFLLPQFFENKVFAVFLAEPVSEPALSPEGIYFFRQHPLGLLAIIIPQFPEARYQLCPASVDQIDASSAVTLNGTGMLIALFAAFMIVGIVMILRKK